MIQSRLNPDNYVCIDNGDYHGWIFIKNTEGMFVTLRTASRLEILDAIDSAVDQVKEEIQTQLNWMECSHSLPKTDGVYNVRIERPDEANKNNFFVFESKRIFHNGRWRGGCRPFSSNDKVIHWQAKWPA